VTVTAAPQNAAPMLGIAALEAITAATVFAPGGIDAIIAKIEAEVRPTQIDISTKAGRDAIASAAYKVSRAKTTLDDMGKELVADWKKQAAAVDADRRKLRDKLDTIKDDIRKPLTDWENAEETRVQQHEAAIASVTAMLAHAGERSAADIEAALLELGEIAQRDWQEYEARAVSTIDHVREGLRKELAAAKQREADQAELASLRAAQAERNRKDELERIAQEAADRARQEAEAAAQANAKRLQDEKDAADQRAKDAERRAEEAAQAERDRIAARQAAEEEATRKREANKRHAAKINNEVLAALVELGVADNLGKKIIVAIVSGEVPHTKISY